MPKFREITTSSGKKVLGGKSAENNEELIAQVKPNEYVLHTAKPGSPFVNIKAPKSRVRKKDIKEAAIFCAAKSRDWRDNKGDVMVHYFLGQDIYKTKTMKPGTFGVKKHEEIKIKKQEIEDFLKKIKSEETKNG